MLEFSSLGKIIINRFAPILQELAIKLNAIESRQDSLESQVLLAAAPANDESLGIIQVAFQPFAVGSLGNFPYYWQDPRNLQFNAKTYDWIRASLKANTSPVQLDEPFTNLYNEALSSISYSLSKADQLKLKEARKNITEQQYAMLSAWRAAFGSIPSKTPTQQPIDIIINEITQTWVSPPTTLKQLQAATDLKSILNKMPAAGEPVVPALSKYLNALDNNISLLNASTMYNGYLQQALAAVQSPSSKNGAMQTSSGDWVPAYAVATPLQQILDGLNSADKTSEFTIEMSVTRLSENEFSVEMNNLSPVTVPTTDFLGIATAGCADLFKDKIAINTTPVKVDATFTGVTMVYFGPTSFSKATLMNWYWMKPIRDAIKNGDQDISGFKFSPNPQIDFTESGPFGFLTGVAISKNPSLSIAAKHADPMTIERDIRATPSVGLTFLGTPLYPMEKQTGYTASSAINDGDSSIQVNLKPSAELAEDSIDSTAFVLGVQTDFPAV